MDQVLFTAHSASAQQLQGKVWAWQWHRNSKKECTAKNTSTATQLQATGWLVVKCGGIYTRFENQQLSYLLTTDYEI